MFLWPTRVKHLINHWVSKHTEYLEIVIVHRTEPHQTLPPTPDFNSVLDFTFTETPGIGIVE